MVQGEASLTCDAKRVNCKAYNSRPATIAQSDDDLVTVGQASWLELKAMLTRPSCNHCGALSESLMAPTHYGNARTNRRGF
eukprot:6455692-Amphidinium_carterae.1